MCVIGELLYDSKIWMTKTNDSRNNPVVILQSPAISKVFNFLPPSNLIANGNPH